MNAKPTIAGQCERTTDSQWTSSQRCIASILLALHVAAVFVAPWSATWPASDLSRTVARHFEPYLAATFLNHGYRFFAPNPGPSHLVEYELHFADGRKQTGRFPDLKQQQPRLLYHRHFMLAEVVNQLSNIPSEPEALPPDLPPSMHPLAIEARHQQMQAREQAIRLREQLLSPIASRLLAEHGAQTVRLWAVEHTILPRQAVMAGDPLDGERTYLKRPLGEFPRQ